MNPSNPTRGYVPDDNRYFSEEAVPAMRTASRHVRFLINEGYDLKQAVTFAGNHFLLSERQRLAVMRSVCTDEQLRIRKSRQVPVADLAGKTVRIDGFNTIITLEVMLCGGILLECLDGTIRDLAALRGTYRVIPETSEAVQGMFRVLEKAKIRKAEILLDEPVSNSGRLKTLIAEIGEEFPFDLDIRILKDVDRSLYGQENVITSDSIILDHCKSWVNLAAECIMEKEPRTIRLCDPVRAHTGDPSVSFRELLPSETQLLQDFTYEAIFIPEGVEPPPKEIVLQPELRIYYEDFGSGPADHGFAAEADGRIAGAVWTRIMEDYGHVDNRTPSLAISLLPEYRGKGIGTVLLERMLSFLKERGYGQVSLSVQKANYAVRMYEKAGFEVIRENKEEYIMICRL